MIQAPFTLVLQCTQDLIMITQHLTITCLTSYRNARRHWSHDTHCHAHPPPCITILYPLAWITWYAPSHRHKSHDALHVSRVEVFNQSSYKTHLMARVFQHHLGTGVLTAEAAGSHHGRQVVDIHLGLLHILCCSKHLSDRHSINWTPNDY